MNRHEGVSCDACLKSNFRGRRFKCLICYDYDLCANCHEENASSSRHLPDHPMQCILTRTDFELYYGGEVLSAEQPQSFTCPYCNKMGLTDVALAEHVSAEHTDASTEVVCPVCAAMQGGEPNFVTDDFAGHLSLEHRTGQRDLISFLDEPSAIRHGGVRRIPHSGRALGGQRSRRSNMHFSSSGALSTLSPSGRESVDPITELLSHLTSVRRGPQSSQLQQLQMQIQMERQQISAARQQLERLPRRQPHPITSLTGASSTTATSGTGLAGPLSGSTFLQALTQQQANGGTGNSGGSSSGNGITISNFSQIPIASSSASAGGGAVGVGSGVSAGPLATAMANQALAGNAANAVANGQGGAAAAAAASNQSQFLLARLLTTPLDEKAQADLEVERADRAQFVQALLLSTIANLDAFRLTDVESVNEPEISDSTTNATVLAIEGTVDDDGGGAEMQDLGDVDANSRNPNKNNNSSSSNNRCTNNAVNNKKLDEVETVTNNHNINVTSSSSDSRQSGAPPPPPVKPKPPTATKPVPHNLPNYASERGAGRGGGIAAGARAAGSSASGGPGAAGGGGGGGMAKGRPQSGQQQQQQVAREQQQQSHGQSQQSNSGPEGARGGSGGGGGGGASGRDCGSDAR